MRRLYGASRRQRGALVPDAHVGGGGHESHHHRGALTGRQPPGPGRLARPQCRAMRLLPDRADHAGGGAAQGHAEPDRRGHRQQHERQHLPLRHLSPHPRRHQAGREGSPAMTTLDRSVLANVSRRSFLVGVGAGSLVLAVGLPSEIDAQEKKFGPDGMPNGWRDDPKIFVAISPDGIVTVTCHRQEMGQGVRTSIAMVVADELGADWGKVRVAQAPGDEARFGNQDTDGSRSLRHFFMPMRRAGAAARTMLEQAAAKQWGVPVSEVAAADHAVTHAKSGRTLGYGAVAKAAADVPVPPRDT